MNATRASRMAAFFATLLLLGLAAVLWSSSPGRASSITLKWADPYDGKPLFIELTPGANFTLR